MGFVLVGWGGGVGGVQAPARPALLASPVPCALPRVLTPPLCRRGEKACLQVSAGLFMAAQRALGIAAHHLCFVLADNISSLLSHPSLLVALVVLAGGLVTYGADVYVFLFDRERYHQLLVRERREYVEETERREKKARLDEQSPLLSNSGGENSAATA